MSKSWTGFFLGVSSPVMAWLSSLAFLLETWFSCLTSLLLTSSHQSPTCFRSAARTAAVDSLLSISSATVLVYTTIPSYLDLSSRLTVSLCLMHPPSPFFIQDAELTFQNYYSSDHVTCSTPFLAPHYGYQSNSLIEFAGHCLPGPYFALQPWFILPLTDSRTSTIIPDGKLRGTVNFGFFVSHFLGEIIFSFF